MGGMIGANAQMRQKIISDNFSLKKSLVFIIEFLNIKRSLARRKCANAQTLPPIDFFLYLGILSELFAHKLLYFRVV